jgi:hypothetical protein
MKSKTRGKPFFMTLVDEKIFSEAIKRVYPHIKFVDDSRWSTPDPVVRGSIDECASNYVFLWPSDVIEKLPTMSHGDKFDGPQSGIVMQFMRCRQKDGCLLSGQIGVGYSEKTEWMDGWSKQIIKILNSMNASKLKVIGEDSYITSDYVVCENAIDFYKSGGQLKYNSGQISYEPFQESNRRNRGQSKIKP